VRESTAHYRAVMDGARPKVAQGLVQQQLQLVRTRHARDLQPTVLEALPERLLAVLVPGVELVVTRQRQRGRPLVEQEGQPG